MSHRTTSRITASILLAVAWLGAGAGAALAKVAPDDPGQLTPTTTNTVMVETIDWSQLALTAAIACLIGIAATVAVMLVVRHSHHSHASVAHV